MVLAHIPSHFQSLLDCFAVGIRSDIRFKYLKSTIISSGLATKRETDKLVRQILLLLTSEHVCVCVWKNQVTQNRKMNVFHVHTLKKMIVFFFCCLDLDYQLCSRCFVNAGCADWDMSNELNTEESPKISCIESHCW